MNVNYSSMFLKMYFIIETPFYHFIKKWSFTKLADEIIKIQESCNIHVLKNYNELVL